VRIDGTGSSPRAAAFVVLDHFTEHSIVIPALSPDPSTGWGPLFTTFAFGDPPIQLLVPDVLFSNTAIHYATLQSELERQAAYEHLLLEQVEAEMAGYCFTTVISAEDLAKITDAGIDITTDLQALTEDPNDVEVGDHLVCYVESDDKLDESIL
jgi:hypothetical protein